MKAFCILAAILVVATSLNFCQVETPQVKIFTTQNQLQQIPLNKHIRGYDLDFTSSDQKIIAVFQPYHPIDKADVTIKSGYAIVNIDGKNSNNHLWGRDGILFAIGGEKNIAVGYGQFASGTIPKIQNYNYYELPYISNCYAGLIYSQNMDVVADCQKFASKPEDNTDLICLAMKSGKVSCKSFGSITKTSKRKSVLLEQGKQRYLLSASLTDHISSKFENQTFVNVYHVNGEQPQFNLIIDRRVLGLYSLSITDIDIVDFYGVSYIVLTDKNSKLIIFRYTQYNSIQDIQIITVQGNPRQFQQTPEGTWLIANEKNVMECTYEKNVLNVIKRYELDPADNQVTDLQSSYLFVAVRTFMGHLYTYDRRYTELKYLLNKEELTESTSVVVSPFYPRLFQINSTMMVSVAISSGYLYVSKVTESVNVVVKAKSGTVTCTLNLRVQLVEDSTSKIYQKKSMTSAYRLQGNQPIKFILSDYFGGSNLKYDVNTKDFTYALQHVNTYKQKISTNLQANEQILFNKVVQIDANSYLIAAFSKVSVRFYKCQLSSGQIACTQSTDEKLNAPAGLTFAHPDGLRRQNGQTYISWTYTNNTQDSNQRIDIKRVGLKNPAMIYIGGPHRYTQTLVGQKYFVYLEKQRNSITFMYFDNQKQLKTFIFAKNDFTQAQLASMGGGFYPRQIMDSHKNPNIFFIKFPIAVVTVSYTGGKYLQVLAYNKVSLQYVPDDLWSIVVGRQTLLLATPNEVAEYSILADGTFQKLHRIPIPTTRQPIFPIKYQLITDTAYFQCQDGSLQYIRLNQPALDSQYYTLNLKNSIHNDGGSTWDVSGSWLITNTNQVYYQYQQPALVITSTVPQSQYKRDVSVTITVSNQADKKDVKANVTVFNYPIKIQASGAEDNGFILPEKGDNQIIPFPIDKYFKGSVAKYSIVCPYSLDGTLTLVEPVRIIKQNADLDGFSAVAKLEDNSGVAVLKDNYIKIIDLDNNVVATEQLQSTAQCVSIGINQQNLVVFCGPNQQIILYQITGKTIKLVKKYPIPGDALLYKPSQINMYRQDGIFTVFIHDVDLVNPQAKQSNIKIFELGDTIIYRGLIDSSSFGIGESQPINSMSIKQNHMLVTIGGKGLGYLNLANAKNQGSFVDLENQEALKDYTLDDTAYLRVSIASTTADTVSALVTTSNSFSYVMQIKVGVNTASFSKITETYKRYGHQRSINWGLIDQKFVMLSFYNKTTTVQSLALYKRNTKQFADFFTTLRFTLPNDAVKPGKSVLLHSNSLSYLFINTPDKPAALGGLTLYNITQQYGLYATYEKPSTFDFIKVTAKNDFYEVARDLKVSFEGQDGGIKWYSIVIVVVLVAIAVGVALGFYLRMKRKKADSKKVSLFTQNQEIDEQV